MRVMERILLSAISVALIASSAVAVAAQSETDAASRPAVPSDGCGVTTAEAGSHLDLSLDVDGLERTWSMRVPPSHDGVTPVPMWLQLHGCCGGTGSQQVMLYSAAADEHGFVLVAPDAHFASGFWMFDAETAVLDTSASNPDIAFIDTLIEHLGAELCIDLARVYAAGYSAGAKGASVLGCVLEDRIAAVAPVAGMLDLGDDCRLDRPVPFLAVHGTADPTVYFDGGYAPSVDDWPVHQAYGQAAIPERVANVALRNGCGAEHTMETSSVAVEAGAVPVERWSWPCPVGAEVGLIVHGGGHSWPSSYDAGFDGTALIWEFFEQHAMPE